MSGKSDYGYPGTAYIGKDGQPHLCRTLHSQPCSKHGANEHVKDANGNVIQAHSQEELYAKINASTVNNLGLMNPPRPPRPIPNDVNSVNIDSKLPDYEASRYRSKIIQNGPIKDTIALDNSEKGFGTPINLINAWCRRKDKNITPAERTELEHAIIRDIYNKPDANASQDYLDAREMILAEADPAFIKQLNEENKHHTNKMPAMQALSNKTGKKYSVNEPPAPPKPGEFSDREKKLNRKRLADMLDGDKNKTTNKINNNEPPAPPKAGEFSDREKELNKKRLADMLNGDKPVESASSESLSKTKKPVSNKNTPLPKPPLPTNTAGTAKNDSNSAKNTSKPPLPRNTTKSSAHPVPLPSHSSSNNASTPANANSKPPQPSYTGNNGKPLKPVPLPTTANTNAGTASSSSEDDKKNAIIDYKKKLNYIAKRCGIEHYHAYELTFGADAARDMLEREAKKVHLSIPLPDKPENATESELRLITEPKDHSKLPLPHSKKTSLPRSSKSTSKSGSHSKSSSTSSNHVPMPPIKPVPLPSDEHIYKTTNKKNKEDETWWDWILE